MIIARKQMYALLELVSSGSGLQVVWGFRVLGFRVLGF